MKKNLLIVPSNLFTTPSIRLKGFFYLMLLFIGLGFSSTGQAQCSQYMVFESFRTVAPAFTSPVTPTVTAPGIMTNYNQGVSGTDYWRAYGIGRNSANVFSGTSAMQYNQSTGYIITPLIKSATGTITLSLKYRNITGSLANLFVEYAPYNASAALGYPGGGADPAGTTWTTFTALANGQSGALSPTTTYATATFTFTPGTTGYYVRIRRAGTTSVPVIDDLAWSSSVTTENTQLVMATQATTTAASCTTVAMDSGAVYTFSDNGGLSDTYTTAVAQDYTINFTSYPGQRVQMKFYSAATPSTDPVFLQVANGGTKPTYDTNGTATGTGTMIISNTDNNVTLQNYTGAAAPVTVYTSTAPGVCTNSSTATVQFKTAAGTIGTGFVMVVSSISASCSNVTSLGVTAANVTYNTIPLTWTALTACAAPSGGYDYYASVTNDAAILPSGAITPSNTTSLQVGNFPSGTSAGGLLTGLASSTPYYIWVRTNCGGSYGTWINTTTTTTLCAPLVVTNVTPEVEDFQGVTLGQLNTSTTCLYSNSGSIGIGSSGGNDYFFNTNNNTWLFSKPLILDPTKIYRVSFDYGNSTNNATTIQAYYGKTNYSVLTNNPGSLLTTVSTSSSTFTTSKSYFQPSSAATYYIGIKVTSLAGGAFILDNLRVDEVPCFPAATPTIVSGPTSSCPATTVTYTATATGVAGTTTSDGLTGATTTATSLTWTVPTGWVLLSQPTTLTASVLTGIIPGNIAASGNLAGCDSSLPGNYAVTSNAIPAQPTAITGTFNFCSLPATYTYSVTNAASSYTWAFPAGWTINSGQGTNSVSVTATVSAVSGTITVTPSNGSCSGTPRTASAVVGNVTNNTFGTATAITTSATDTFRCGLRHFWYAYTVPAGCGGSFKINLAGNGGDIDLYVFPSSPSITNQIPQPTTGIITGGSSLSASATEAVTVNLTAGSTYNILVFAYTSTVDAGGTFNLSVSSLSIGTPGPISGTGSVSCSSVTTTTYSIPAVSGATGYTWTVPAGWTINSGQGTTSISVTTNGTSAGVVSVIATSPCGISIPANKTITVGQIQPASITGATQLCSPFSSTTYSITPVVGATSYVWTIPSGWAGSSTTTSISVIPTGNSGNITVAAVGPCGTSPVTTLAVATASAVTATNAVMCKGDASIPLTAAVNPVSTFTMSDVPTSGATTFVRSFGGTTYSSSGTTVAYTTTTITTLSTGAGTYVFNGCASGDTFLHIYDTTFSAASPATNFLAANDDGNDVNCTLDPRITIDLLANHTYVLVYSTYSSTTSGITGITMTVTPPGGVAGILFGSTDWYLVASGGSPIYSGASFDPTTVGGSGVTDTNTAGVSTYYATNSLSSFCRAPVTFTINDKPTVSVSPASINVCPNSVYLITATVTGTGAVTTWTSTVANSLFTNSAGTTAYAGGNTTTIYVKTGSSATVTATSSVGACTNTATATLTALSTKTWNGSAWSPINIAPGINEAIVLAGDYSAGDLTGCNCKVTSGTVTFASGKTLNLTNELTVTGGSISFGEGSSLVQTNNVTNSGNITYTRNTTPSFKYDYTYWSTPVNSQNLSTFFPTTSWDGFYQYNSAIPQWQWVNSTTTAMSIGKGYIVRVPNTFNPAPGGPSGIYTANFVGVPNNGTYTANVYGAASQLNLLGNPYPSAISCSKFVSDPANNTIIDATIYFWTHNTALNASYQYAGSDYAVWNILGGINTHPATNPGLNMNTPNGNIAAGQGFFIKGLDNGTATFSNSMRVGYSNEILDNTQFFKNNSTSVSNSVEPEKHRLWLDISNPVQGAYKQMLVGYIAGGTLGWDRGFDSEMVDIGNVATLYTMLGDKKLSIQGRGLPFDDQDLIPVGFKSTVDDTFTISLNDFDGLFATQNIYLEDTTLNVIHDLKTSPYVFATTAGTYEDRFVLRFTTTALGVPTFSDQSVVVYRNGEGLHINTGASMMKSVAIYDVMGRLISSSESINATTTKFTTLPATEEVLLVKITSTDGVTVTKKVIY